MSITPKNWSTFQHYKDRKPAWIKLHHGLLDDYTFARLPVASRALAPMLWLLASEYKDGEITASFEEIAFRFRMTHAELCEAVHPLVEAKFFLLTNDVAARLPPASGSLAEPEPVAIPERERQVREEKEYLSEPSSDASDVPREIHPSSPLEFQNSLTASTEQAEVFSPPPRKRISYSADFDEFWLAYPTDALMSKKQAFDAWKRLTPEDRAKARSAVAAFVAYCRKKPDYRPLHAVRFLTQRRFDGLSGAHACGEPINDPNDWRRAIV